MKYADSNLTAQRSRTHFISSVALGLQAFNLLYFGYLKGKSRLPNNAVEEMSYYKTFIIMDLMYPMLTVLTISLNVKDINVISPHNCPFKRWTSRCYHSKQKFS